MYIQVGSYPHPVNEVNLQRMEIFHRFSNRNKRLTTRYTLHLAGELQAVGQSAITTAIGQFLDAYQSDYQAIGLYQDDGTRTHHYIDNVNSISGVKIVRRDWPLGDAAEYATKRTFNIQAYSEYVDIDSPLVYWSESVELIGTGGPERVVRDFYDGPVEGFRRLATSQTIIQSGESIGFLSYVDWPGPMYPASELQTIRRRKNISGTNQGLESCFYKREWTYTHRLIQPRSDALPTTR